MVALGMTVLGIVVVEACSGHSVGVGYRAPGGMSIAAGEYEYDLVCDDQTQVDLRLDYRGSELV